jgi:hypothetical protein
MISVRENRSNLQQKYTVFKDKMRFKGLFNKRNTGDWKRNFLEKYVLSPYLNRGFQPDLMNAKAC